MVCETFLEVYGCRLCVSDEELVLTFFAVAAGRVSEEELGAWVRAGWGSNLPLEPSSSSSDRLKSCSMLPFRNAYTHRTVLI